MMTNHLDDDWREERATAARRFFDRIDKSMPEGVHILVAGQPRCRTQPGLRCCFDKIEAATAAAVSIRLELRKRADDGNEPDVRIARGVCPACGNVQ